MKAILIVLTDDQEFISSVVDLATGRAQAQLAAVLGKTGEVLHQAEAINLNPPKGE